VPESLDMRVSVGHSYISPFGAPLQLLKYSFLIVLYEFRIDSLTGDHGYLGAKAPVASRDEVTFDMTTKLLARFIEMLSMGNRPLRILLFGGIFFTWLIMMLLATLFGIETDIGGTVTVANIILIVISILAGFGTAFGIFLYLEGVQKRREDQDHRS